MNNSTYIPFTNTAISSPNNLQAAPTLSLTWPFTRPNPTPTRLVVLGTPQWIHNHLTGSDSLQQPRVCTLNSLHTKSHLYTTSETTDYDTPRDKHTTHLVKNMKTDELIDPKTPDMSGNNAAHFYSTSSHAAIKPLNRQLLRMGTSLPETC